MSVEISLLDKLNIIFRTIIKVMRGCFKGLFLKKFRFPFFVGKNVFITHSKHINVGKNVKFEAYSEIHGLCTDGLIFGDNVTIGLGTMIRPSSYYGVGRLGKGLFMDDNSSIGPYSYIGCAGKISIGKNVMIGPKASLFAENHNFKNKKQTIKSQGVIQKGIIIEDDCWIGSGVTILDDVRIGKGSVIAAGTLVSKDVPKNSIIMDRRNREMRMR